MLVNKFYPYQFCYESSKFSVKQKSRFIIERYQFVVRLLIVLVLKPVYINDCTFNISLIITFLIRLQIGNTLKESNEYFHETIFRLMPFQSS